MRYLFLFIFFGCAQIAIQAKTSPYFDEHFQSRLNNFNCWQSALNNCKPNNDQQRNLSGCISRSRKVLNNNSSTPSTTTHYSLEPEMVFVQGGSFEMGSNGGEEDEKPVHSVTLSSYYIGKYEVTQKQWRDVMGADPAKLAFPGCDDCPVERVSWDEVQTFLQKLNSKTGKNYRLPTEAEWEFAALGGNSSKNYTYSGSNDLGAVAWYKENSDSKTHSVGGKQVNELNICDMTGNVWEWCSDWYDEKYYESSPSENPKGATSGSLRVNRGGSWRLTTVYCRLTNRNGNGPSFREQFLGFRVALSSK